MKRLVLVGSGHAHVEVLRRSGHTPVPDVDITLISPGRNRVYSATLPGLVAGHYGWRACHIDLEVCNRVVNSIGPARPGLQQSPHLALPEEQR